MNQYLVVEIVNLAIFFALIYMVKQILDSEKVIKRHPYLKNPLLRAFLIMMIIGPLVVAVKPALRDLGHMVFDMGILGVLVMVGYLYDTYFIKVSLNYTSDISASYVGAEQYISIPSDKYIQVAPGVWDRRIREADQFISEDEKQVFETALDLFNFDENIIILVRFSQDANFPEHYHTENESFYLIDGKVSMGEDFGDIKKGESITIPARHPHIFKAKEAGQCIIGLKKL